MIMLQHDYVFYCLYKKDFSMKLQHDNILYIAEMKKITMKKGLYCV